MSKLDALRKKRGANLKALQEKLESSNSGPRDERIWRPKIKDGKSSGTAIVRFLPAVTGDHFVEVKSYNFKDKNGWFSALSPQNLGEEDPIQIACINAYRKAKNSGDDRYKNIGKKFLPKSTYYANVFVIKDENNPENEGQVRIYQFGRAIYLKLQAIIKPEYDDVQAMDPFDLWEGADFKIRMKENEIPDQKDPTKKVMVPNYDDAGFDSPSEFMNGDEDALEQIVEKVYDLSEFVAPEKHKSFDELAELFKKVTGNDYRWLDPDFVQGEHIRNLTEDAEQDAKEKEKEAMEQEASYSEPESSGSEQEEREESEEPDSTSDVLARFKALAQKKS